MIIAPANTPRFASDDAGADVCVQRYDYAEIPRGKAIRTTEGYLKATGVPVARLGVQTYLNADGSERRELRLAEHVYAPEALDGANGMPIANNHPGPEHGRRVDITNSRDLVVGASFNFRADAAQEYLLADLMVYDGDTVRDVERGKREISMGYYFVPEPLAGGKFQQPGHAFDGAEADLLQTQIRINHTAIVNRGRANIGDPRNAVRIRLDEAGNQPGPTGAPETENMKTVKVIIKGAEFDVAPEVKAALDAAETKTPTQDKAAELADKVIATQVSLQQAVQRADQAEGSLAAANAEIEKLKAAQATDAATDEQRADHYDLVQKVAKAVGAEARTLVAKSTEDLRRTLAEKLTGDSLDGKSPDYVAGVLAHAEKSAAPNAVAQASRATGPRVAVALDDVADSPLVAAMKARTDLTRKAQA